jgi:uncharacterized protein (TIGR02246 family)
MAVLGIAAWRSIASFAAECKPVRTQEITMPWNICRTAFQLGLCAWLGAATGEAARGQRAAESEPNSTANDQATNVESGNPEVPLITAAVEAYEQAFNAREVDKLVALWSPEAVYTSRTSGEQLVGREALAAEFGALLAADDAPRLSLSSEAIEFISPNVALERGRATVARGEQEATETGYSAVYVKRDGQWLLDRVTEELIEDPPSHYEQLRNMEWSIGQWYHEGEGISVELDCQWTRNRNYISCLYTVTGEDGVESSGLQIIGWDALQKQIRSWLFDSDGGFVAGVWQERDDGHWVVTSVATLADGGRGSFTSTYRPLEDGAYAWQKINQVVDGQLLPNTEEIVLRRR